MPNNTKNFFDHIRKTLFNNRLNQKQVDGINQILNISKDLNAFSRAYMLATVYFETAKTMQPISEYGKGAKYNYGRWKLNSKGEKYCYKMGIHNGIYFEKDNPNLFYGRGFVQLTWFNNYEKLTERLHKANLLDKDKSLLIEPELANNLEIASNILKIGMVEGLFTGKKLTDYINISKKDYVNARKIINGNDHKHLIADYAKEFEKALKL